MTSSLSPGVISVGAYDRFNYGDLLFPLVLDHAAQALGYPALTHVAPQRSDLSGVGAAPTRSISDVFADQPGPSGVILGGGEVLGATWGQAAATIAPVPFDIPLLALRKFVSTRAYDAVGKALLRGNWPTPYVPSADAVRSAPLVLNAIGASSLASLDEATRRDVVATLSTASFASVRDTDGMSQLGNAGVGAELAPDSVAILPRLHPPAAARDGEVLVIQASRAWMRNHRTGLVAAVGEIARRYSRVDLLPIGLAGAHADRQALEALRKGLADTGVEASLVEPTTVWTIADSIAGASMFVGTSLHGAITSMAYATPFVPLDGINKLGSYAATWAAPLAARPVGTSDVPRAVAEAAAVSQDLRASHAAELDRLSWANTERVLDASFANT